MKMHGMCSCRTDHVLPTRQTSMSAKGARKSRSSKIDESEDRSSYQVRLIVQSNCDFNADPFRPSSLVISANMAFAHIEHPSGLSNHKSCQLGSICAICPNCRRVKGRV